MADPNIRIKRSSVPGKRPTAEQLPLGELALNTYDAELFARRERTGIGTDIVRIICHKRRKRHQYRKKTRRRKSNT
jgi:hypothetical protein